MRILVVGAIQGGSVPIGRSIYRGFKEIGTEASFLDFSDLLDEMIEVRASGDTKRSYQFHLKHQTRLVEEVKEYEPDVIFGIAQSPISDVEILSGFRRAGIKLCYWFVEDYEIFEYWRRLAPHFDHFFTIQKEPFWQELEAVGCRNYHYLPTAFDSNGGFPADDAKGKIPVSFVGAPYPNRVHFFSKLPRDDFQIYGEGWNKHPNPAVVVGDRRVSQKEVEEIYRRSIININLHSSVFATGFRDGDFLNPRTFELAGLGAFQLTNMRRLFTLHFDPAYEVIALNSWEDMVKAIDYFLDHAEERQALAARARERVRKEHTYKHRAEDIVSIVS